MENVCSNRIHLKILGAIGKINFRASNVFHNSSEENLTLKLLPFYSKYLKWAYNLWLMILAPLSEKLKRKTTMFMSSCSLPIGRVICADLLPCNPSHSCLFYCSFPSYSSDLVSSLCQGNRLPEERPETMLKIEKRTCKSVSPSKPPSSRMP